MECIEFEGQNVVYAKDQPEYRPLPAFRDDTGGRGIAVSCWKLTDEELKQLNETKVIWVSLMTFNRPLQPLRLDVERPPIIDEGRNDPTHGAPADRDGQDKPRGG